MKRQWNRCFRLDRLIEDRLMVSDLPKGPVRLGFPVKAVGYYFPRLYPEGVEMR
jgi:hypothetical protein